MSVAAFPPDPAQEAPEASKALRRLFLTLLLRGRSSRGLTKENAPTSLASRMGLILLFYSLFGLVSLVFIGQPMFFLAAFLHCFSFMFVGIFVTASVGEVLFNKEESEILLHRPVLPKTLLRAKISVLAMVSLWVAGAINLVGFVVGIFARDGGWAFPLIHAASTVLETLFCAGCAVLVLQVCLKYFGRERVEGVMTAAQVVLTITMVVGSQLLSRQIGNIELVAKINWHAWWINIMPPVWFAGLDDAVAGSHSQHSWMLAAAGVGVTVVTLRLVFGRLAGTYQSGLQALGESGTPKPEGRKRGSFASAWADSALMRPFLNGSVDRASFALCIAYLLRDRDVQLRVYPGVAPMLVMPFTFLLMGHQELSTHAGRELMGSITPMYTFFSGCYMGYLPFTALRLLKYSQQWKASENFQIAPVPGPWAFHRGAQVAVISCIALPITAALGVYVTIAYGPISLLMLIPGLIAMPVYALLEATTDTYVILSKPSDEVRAANRGCAVMSISMLSIVLGLIAFGAWSAGLYVYFLLLEAATAVFMCVLLDQKLKKTPWRSLE